MVAQTVSTSQPAFRGIRPFSPRTDLYGVAHLLEEAFRSEHSFPLSDLPFMREVGIVMWTLNYAPTFPETLEGFVWVENGKIVGNATLAVDLVHGNRYYISNVAVKTEYRRQGIARALVQASLEHIRRQRAQSVLLNVRPKNEGAIRLYEGLGFKTMETRSEWTLASLPLRLPPMASTELRRLQLSDARAVSDLIRAATPANVHPFRPRPNPFKLTWDERLFESIGDFFIGQTTRRWVMERDGRLAALLLIRANHLTAPHRITIETHPDFRGRVEDELLIAAWQEFAKFPAREIRADTTSTYPELIAVLERHGFRFLNGMTLMELTL